MPKRLRFNSNRLAQERKPRPLTFSQLSSTRSYLLHHSLEPSTRDKYRSSRKLWYRFCHRYQLSRLPTAYSLELFVTFLIHRGHTSIYSTLSGLAAKYGGTRRWEKARDSARVKKLVEGGRKDDPKEVKQAAPIEPHHLIKICRTALESPSDPYTALLTAFIACMAFCGLMRLGEAVAPEKKRYRNAKKVSKRSTFNMTDNEISWRLPYHKGAADYTTSHVSIRRELVPSTVPVFEIARAFLRARDDRFPPGTGNDFLFASKDGGLLSRRAMINATKEAGELTGHSYRAGGATYLAKIGVPDVEIQRCGRWATEAMKRYIRSHSSLLAALRSWAVGRRYDD